jgi:hypothetical protein
MELVHDESGARVTASSNEAEMAHVVLEGNEVHEIKNIPLKEKSKKEHTCAY